MFFPSSICYEDIIKRQSENALSGSLRSSRTMLVKFEGNTSRPDSNLLTRTMAVGKTKSCLPPQFSFDDNLK